MTHLCRRQARAVRSTRWCAAIVAWAAIGVAWAQSRPPSIAAYQGSAFAIDSAGVLWAWGDDSGNQLGLGRSLSVATPQVVGTGFPTERWKSGQAKVAMGRSHAAAVRSDGSLVTWGGNHFGQLGTGSNTDSNRPSAIGKGFVAVATGNAFTLALDDAGRAHEFTGNKEYLIPNGPWAGIAAGGNLRLLLRSSGELFAQGGILGVEYGPVAVPVGTDFVAMSVGQFHVLALKSDGSLWGWGGNVGGARGDADPGVLDHPIRIHAGPFRQVLASWPYSAALDANGSVWAWGIFFSERPSIIASGFVAIGGGEGALLGVKADGTLWKRAPALDLGFVPVSAGRFSAVSASLSTTYFAVGSDGVLWGWGNDNLGQVGVGSAVRQVTPRRIGSNFAAVVPAGAVLALKTDGALWRWGSNGSAQAAPTQLPGSDWVAVAAGGDHYVALKRDGTLWSWGNNYNGQLGDGSTTDYRDDPVQIGSGFSKVAAGETHTLALKADGSLWAWGSNEFGKLGDGTTVDRHVPTKVGENFTQVFAAGHSSFAIGRRFDAYGWGANWFGQLGDGTTTPRDRPTPIPGRFATLSSNGNYTLALDPDRQLYAWGLNGRAEFGDGTTTDSLTPRLVPGARWASVSASQGHSLGMRADGSVWAAGLNLFGNFGTGTLVTPLLEFRPVLNESGNDYLDLTPETPIDPTNRLLAFFAVAQLSGIDLESLLTDRRAEGLTGDIYFSALVPANSPLRNDCSSGGCGGALAAASTAGGTPSTRRGPLATRSDAAAGTGGGIHAGVLSRDGFKQTGGSSYVAAPSAYSGDLGRSGPLNVYANTYRDPLANSAVVICMGVTVPELSAKGQVLMRPIATGTAVQGVVQCPPVQTAATIARFRSEASGPITSRTVVAVIDPLDEDRGKTVKVFSWAVAPDGRQFMQTGPNRWEPMAEPMQPAATVTVPASGSYRLEVTRNLDLTGLDGTLVFVGLGQSWEDVRSLNKAGHHYTVQ